MSLSLNKGLDLENSRNSAIWLNFLGNSSQVFEPPERHSSHTPFVMLHYSLMMRQLLSWPHGFSFAIALAVAGLPLMQRLPGLAQPNRLCTTQHWATELEAQFSGYRVAICVGGMNPTHVILQKNGEGAESPQVLPLDRIRPDAPREEPQTIDLLPNGSWFYQATAGSKTYRVIIQGSRVAKLQITEAGTKTEQFVTNQIDWVDMEPAP